MVEATVVVDGRKIAFGTTHMSYTHRFEITQRKSQETDLLINEISKHTDSFILTGDFNAGPGSYTINSVESCLKNASPDYQVPTWTTKPFSYNGFEETQLKWRLDYIFATRDMKILSSKVIDTDYSDHLPVMTTFELS